MSNYERKKNSCDFCIRIFKFIPVIFIFAVIIWSYYAYVIQLSFCKCPDPFSRYFCCNNFDFFYLAFVSVFSICYKHSTKSPLFNFLSCHSDNVHVELLSDDFYRFWEGATESKCLEIFGREH
jgi:hypothetical protein